MSIVRATVRSRQVMRLCWWPSRGGLGIAALVEMEEVEVGIGVGGRQIACDVMTAEGKKPKNGLDSSGAGAVQGCLPVVADWGDCKGRRERLKRLETWLEASALVELLVRGVPH